MSNLQDAIAVLEENNKLRQTSMPLETYTERDLQKRPATWGASTARVYQRQSGPKIPGIAHDPTRDPKTGVVYTPSPTPLPKAIPNSKDIRFINDPKRQILQPGQFAATGPFPLPGSVVQKQEGATSPPPQAPTVTAGAPESKPSPAGQPGNVYTIPGGKLTVLDRGAPVPANIRQQSPVPGGGSYMVGEALDQRYTAANNANVPLDHASLQAHYKMKGDQRISTSGFFAKLIAERVNSNEYRRRLENAKAQHGIDMLPITSAGLILQNREREASIESTKATTAKTRAEAKYASSGAKGAAAKMDETFKLLGPLSQIYKTQSEVIQAIDLASGPTKEALQILLAQMQGAISDVQGRYSAEEQAPKKDHRMSITPQ